MNTPPVLFLIFNRPDTTVRVFERIRQAKPRRLFVAADGPRPGLDDEARLCAETRGVVDKVDWDCEVKTLYRDNNIGCRKAVSEAVTWFFEHVEEGIILEDDCLPEPTFFSFCTELLEHYKDDKSVMQISGYNELGRESEFSYFFSKHSIPLGWATWRNRWKNARFDKDGRSPEAITKVLSDNLGSGAAVHHWRKKIIKNQGAQTVWSYDWKLSIWEQRGVCIVPNANLISNLGFGATGTNCRNLNSGDNARETTPLTFPLKHPLNQSVNKDGDKRLEAERWGVVHSRFKRTFRKPLKRLRSLVKALSPKGSR